MNLAEEPVDTLLNNFVSSANGPFPVKMEAADHSNYTLKRLEETEKTVSLLLQFLSMRFPEEKALLRDINDSWNKAVNSII